MNSHGALSAERLHERGEAVLAIDTDARKLATCPATLWSAAPTILRPEEATLPQAKMLISALQIEDSNTLLAFRGQQAGVPTAIHAFDPSVADELRELEVIT
jgi:Trk K+ transport system NAD-binding subunit